MNLYCRIYYCAWQTTHCISVTQAALQSLTLPHFQFMRAPFPSVQGRPAVRLSSLELVTMWTLRNRTRVPTTPRNGSRLFPAKRHLRAPDINIHLVLCLYQRFGRSWWYRLLHLILNALTWSLIAVCIYHLRNLYRLRSMSSYEDSHFKSKILPSLHHSFRSFLKKDISICRLSWHCPRS